jgi:hypothetical protein
MSTSSVHALNSAKARSSGRGSYGTQTHLSCGAGLPRIVHLARIKVFPLAAPKAKA